MSQVAAVTLYLKPAAPGGLKVAALGLALFLTVTSGFEYAWRGRRLLHAA